MKYIILLLIMVILFPTNTFASQGCCSWHGGQDYCDEEVGKWVCKDGTYSPSCKCGNYTLENYSDNSEYNNAASKHPIIEFLLGYFLLACPLTFSTCFLILIIYDMIKNKKSNKNLETTEKIFDSIFVKILLLVASLIIEILYFY